MVDLMGYSVLVDNEEQAKKLQEIAFEQGFEWGSGSKVIRYLDKRSFQFGLGGKKVITRNITGNHYQDIYITKKAHFNDLFKSLENKGDQLRAEAKRRGYTRDNFKCLINRELEGLEDIDKWYYEEFSDTLYTMPAGEGGNAVYSYGTWAELKETLQEKEQRLLKELEEVRKEIDEQNKPKTGDWCKFLDDYTDEFLIGKYKMAVFGLHMSCDGRTFSSC